MRRGGRGGQEEKRDEKEKQKGEEKEEDNHKEKNSMCNKNMIFVYSLEKFIAKHAFYFITYSSRFFAQNCGLKERERHQQIE